MAPIPQDALDKLWDDYVTNHLPDSKDEPVFNYRELDLDYTDKDGKVIRTEKVKLPWYEISYNQHTLRVTFEVFGNQPADGYALYIGLHGRGQTTNGVNNQQWWDMVWHYRLSVEWLGHPDLEARKLTPKAGTIYITLRGVTDDSDLHSRPETFVLLQRLITQLHLPNKSNQTLLSNYGANNTNKTYYKLDETAKHLVNSNQVYLLGFSAGGYGVYQLSAQNADIFAAVNMSAGHSNGVNLQNLANLPICLQVGDSDTDWGHNTNTVDNALTLRSLAEDLPGCYIHDCYLHVGNHNNWSGSEKAFENGEVITSLRTWHTDSKLPQTKKLMNTNAPRWVGQYVRTSTPTTVVWNLAVRPRAPDSAAERVLRWQPKAILYWVYLRDLAKAAAALIANTPGTTVIQATHQRATGDRLSNTIRLEHGSPDYIGFLVNEDMFDFTKPVDVFIGSGAAAQRLPSVTLTASDVIRKQTLEMRGDSNFVFSAALYFQQDAGSWKVVVADSL